MPKKNATQENAVKTAAELEMTLADGLSIARTVRVYALPYYTRDGADTEYLISNPNPTAVGVQLVVIGKECKVAKKLEFTLKPNCTRSVRLRAIVPEHAAFCGVIVKESQLVIHLLYARADDIAIVGGELAGQDNLFIWRNERSRTYGFGYRTEPLGNDKMSGAVFVSNPHSVNLTGQIIFFGQRCEAVAKKRISIKPGCTQEFPFPPKDFGYGLISVSAQAVINVLHFADSAKGLTAAELVGESNLVTAPTEPPTQPRTKVLFDDTHDCRPGVTGDWTQYEAAIVAAGNTVAHHTAATVTLTALQRHDVFVVTIPRVRYSAAEKQAIVDYVNGGGGLLVVQDFGNAPWSVPTREILNLFGASDDNNMMEDPTNPFTPGQFAHVVFDAGRNFLPHPIVSGLKSFHVNAASTLSGGSGWATVVETDDDSNPARRPAVLARAFGSGRVVAFGDSNTWANHLIADLENRRFGVRCIEWLLFKI